MSHCLTTLFQRIYMLSRRPYPLTVALEFRQVYPVLLRNSSFFIYCTQTECSCTPCPIKYTPWLLTVSCCNLSAILLINPLNRPTVRLSLRSHQRSSAFFVIIVRLSRRIRILVVSASYRRLHKKNSKYDCSFPHVLSRTRRDFWFMCVAACIVVSWRN